MSTQAVKLRELIARGRALVIGPDGQFEDVVAVFDELEAVLSEAEPVKVPDDVDRWNVGECKQCGRVNGDRYQCGCDTCDGVLNTPAGSSRFCTRLKGHSGDHWTKWAPLPISWPAGNVEAEPIKPQFGHDPHVGEMTPVCAPMSWHGREAEAWAAGYNRGYAAERPRRAEPIKRPETLALKRYGVDGEFMLTEDVLALLSRLAASRVPANTDVEPL